jgi:predicted secreted protein
VAPARLTTFAPRPVVDALHATNQADQKFREKLSEWHDRGYGEQLFSIFQEAIYAATAADEADKAFEDLAYVDLALRPSQRSP